MGELTTGDFATDTTSILCRILGINKGYKPLKVCFYSQSLNLL